MAAQAVSPKGAPPDRTRLTDPLAEQLPTPGTGAALVLSAVPDYLALMTRSTRSNDWGFPRWRGYGSTRDAQPVRQCDRFGCEEPGDRPAPKSPNSPDRWLFCERHAAEYNRGWNYFEGLSAEDAAAREAEESSGAQAFRQAGHYGWGGSGDGSRSRDEMRALDLFELDPDAGFDDIRTAYRRLAKAHHPDLKPGDAEAAIRFHAIQAAYEILRRAEGLRSAA